MRKRGKIIWYSITRRIGTIIDSERRRYFFHQGCIAVGPSLPKMDSIVTFVVDEEPAKADPNKLPIARRIEILADGLHPTEPTEPTAGQAALATGVDGGSGVKQ